MKNLVGMNFGRLTVQSLFGMRKLPSGESRRHWTCSCHCGNSTIVATRSLIGNATRSCGCLAAEIARNSHITHGMYASPEHRSWSSMWGRCTNESNKDYHRYGARGISVHPAWKDFAVFFSDMGKRPSALHTLDRIDNSGNYEKSNCRWATADVQANNRRSTIRFEFDGQLRTVSELASIAGTTNSIMYARLVSHNWPLNRALGVAS